MSRSSSAGTWGLSCAGGTGACRRIAVISCARSNLPNGRCPVAISYSTAPAE